MQQNTLLNLLGKNSLSFVIGVDDALHRPYIIPFMHISQLVLLGNPLFRSDYCVASSANSSL